MRQLLITLHLESGSAIVVMESSRGLHLDVFELVFEHMILRGIAILH